MTALQAKRRTLDASRLQGIEDRRALNTALLADGNLDVVDPERCEVGRPCALDPAPDAASVLEATRSLVRGAHTRGERERSPCPTGPDRALELSHARRGSKARPSTASPCAIADLPELDVRRHVRLHRCIRARMRMVADRGVDDLLYASSRCWPAWHRLQICQCCPPHASPPGPCSGAVRTRWPEARSPSSDLAKAGVGSSGGDVAEARSARRGRWKVAMVAASAEHRGLSDLAASAELGGLSDRRGQRSAVQVDRARFRRGIVRLVAVDADRRAVLEECADRERRPVRR
jgi:hypothetical protein